MSILLHKSIFSKQERLVLIIFDICKNDSPFVKFQSKMHFKCPVHHMGINGNTHCHPISRKSKKKFRNFNLKRIFNI